MIGAMLAVLGALEQEISEIRRLLDAPTIERVAHLEVHRGRLAGRPVLLARCGVGKVNGALATAALHAAGAESVLFTGVAGGIAPGMHVGDLVVATDLVQHDVDVTALGRPRGQLIFEPLSWAADEAMSQQVLAACRSVLAPGSGPAATAGTVHRGRIASGDRFVASPSLARDIHDEFGALCVEMEGAAVAQAATALGMPFAVVRALSDTADDGAVSDFPAFLGRAARVTASIVQEFVRR